MNKEYLKRKEYAGKLFKIILLLCTKLFGSFFRWAHHFSMAASITGPQPNKIILWLYLLAKMPQMARTSEKAVCESLQQIWNRVTIKDLLKYVNTMPDRCRAVIEAHGGHTRYWAWTPSVGKNTRTPPGVSSRQTSYCLLSWKVEKSVSLHFTAFLKIVNRVDCGFYRTFIKC